MAVTGAAVATANAVPAVTQSRQRRRRGADATGDTHPRAVTAATDLKHQQRRRQQVHQGADDHLGRPRGCARHEQQGAEEGADSGGVRRRREQHGHWPVEQKVLKRKAASRQTDLGGGRGGGGGEKKRGGGGQGEERQTVQQGMGGERGERRRWRNPPHVGCRPSQQKRASAAKQVSPVPRQASSRARRRAPSETTPPAAAGRRCPSAFPSP